MATVAPYDGPGVYDEPYQVRESLETVRETISVIRKKAAKVRYIDSMVAYLNARKTRINNNTETDEEKNGHQHTVLQSGAMSVLPPGTE